MPGLPGEAQGDRPSVALLDARERGLDEAGLRRWAAEMSQGATHTSRSYRYPYALVACHTRQVGVDIERVEELGAEFLDSILTPGERLTVGTAYDARHVSSLWCSKEALAKALGDALRYDPRRLESPAGWPGETSGPWRALALDAPPGHVAWLCWRSS